MIFRTLFLTFGFIFVMISCNDDPVEPEKGICQAEYYLDGDYPNCDCSEETHFIYNYADGREECFRKLDLAFRATFTDSICFEGVSDDMLDGGNAVFIFKIQNSDKYIMHIYEDSNSATSFGGQIGDIQIDTLSDGRYRFSAIDYGRKYQCYDYGDESDCDSSIFGYMQGETNADNTEMEIKVQYRDCSNQILGTGYINCYKDW